MVHRALREARGSDAVVRVVPFATTTAIRDALAAGDVHVLHLSGHGGPGVLVLENDDGQARRVTAGQFLREAVPAGCMPAVISLAACYTDAPAADGAASFAADLAANGAAAVIGTETSVTDRYATRVFARTYKNLAAAAPADVVAALAQARREVHRELAGAPDPRDRQVAELDEWGTVTVLAGTSVTVIGDPMHTDPQAAVTDSSPRSFRGLPARPVGEFVGRRVEQHWMPRVLLDNNDVRHHGVLLAGIGGVGKTTLAVEVLRRVVDRDPNRMVVTVVGETNVDQVLAGIGAPARRALMMCGQTHTSTFQAVQLAGRMDLPWQDRWQLLRDHWLDHQPVVLVLDNFEDNLADADPDGHRSIRVDDLAELLAEIVSDPGCARLLITSRHPFGLPRNAQTGLCQRHLGPLTLAETLKLVWGLPRLDAMDDADIEHIWRVVGGHPRALEYLDALLDQGQGRFPDISQRLTNQVNDLLGDGATAWLETERNLDAALADAVTVAADDVLLPELVDQIRLVPGAEDALLGLSVYQTPVDAAGLLFQVGEPDLETAWSPDLQAIQERITAALTPHDLDFDTLQGFLNSEDSASQSTDELLSSVTPELQELRATPRPGLRWAHSPDPILGVLVRSSLLTDTKSLFVHRWTASELARIWRDEPKGQERLRTAHRRASEYWLWRYEKWPQGLAAAVTGLHEARYHLLQAGERDEAVNVTWVIVRHLHTWGAWDRADPLINHAMTLLSGTDPRRADWYNEMGALANGRGDNPEAERLYRKSLKICKQSGNEAGMASAYHNLGMLAQGRGEYPKAERLLRQSLEIEVRLGNSPGVAISYHQLGTLAHARGDYRNAERLYRQALEIGEGSGRRDNSATYHQLGILAQERGNYEGAKRLYHQALSANERIGHLASAASNYHQLGALAMDQGDYPEAERLHRQALELRERIDDLAGVASSKSELGMLAMGKGDQGEAERLHRQALELRERIGDPAAAAASYHALGMLAQDRRDYPEAERLHRKALKLRERIGDLAGAASSHFELGVLAHSRKNYPDADRLYRRCLTIYEQLGNFAAKAAALHNLGMLAQDRGNYPLAERMYMRSLDIKNRLGDQISISSTISQIGLLRAKQLRYVEAVPFIVRALVIRLNLDLPQVQVDLSALHLLQVRMPSEQFEKALLRVVDANTFRELVNLLARIRRSSDNH